MKIHLSAAIIASLICSCHKVPPGDYDLEAISVTFLPKEIHVGDGVVFTQILKNRGKDTIPKRAYKTALYVDKELVSFDRATSPFLPGTESIYSMSPGHAHWTPTKAGVYGYRFVLDEDNNLKETNESNNVIIGTIIVKERP